MDHVLAHEIKTLDIDIEVYNITYKISLKLDPKSRMKKIIIFVLKIYIFVNNKIKHWYEGVL